MKYNLSELMKTAWQFVRVNGYTMSDAMKQAWLHFKLKAMMAEGVVRFYYQKVDGTIREAWGTLDPRRLPSTKGNRRMNATVQTYFDTEVDDFRSYKKANLMRIA